ncbi:MAG: HIT family protein [Sphingobacteriales bacterium]|mgnify:CR=1 FL=1|jgi:histidine triad (HIT) family protein|nr:HIT family protein [Sphingobacteriales bacterium]MBP9140065.1 HIT family protein [Chitinophagales bacterium]MDA0197853.1 HIT family protein [Bacteroidota bacterium]MBK6889926.1 HIT family protein [Sphingobacteriales bacterium]MBK7527550.1 HIT family protein [Sphingobacteriales bacterium]
MSTIFSRIIAGQIPSYKIAENDRYFAFLDINPIAEGHTLVVPKHEIDYFFDLDNADLSGIMLFSKKIATALRLAVPCQRIGIAVVGLEVPHAHVHLVPLQTIHDLDFTKPRLQFTPQQYQSLTEGIRSKLPHNTATFLPDADFLQ